MRLVILKINLDVINGGIGTAMIGIFNKDGVLIESKLLPGRLFAKRFNYSEGDELFLIPSNHDFEAI